MIYDNPYCLKYAKHLLEQYGHDKDLLLKEISGELNRFFRLGQTSVLRPVKEALEKADGAIPR